MGEFPPVLTCPAMLREPIRIEGKPMKELLYKGSVKDVYEVDANTEEAISRGVFGVPAYLIGDQLFWGQDRLNFVERALAL
ncbi:MAG: hypothetical protein HN372_05120 [Acidiferrobacteraceae bacterium]|nr:hypothetical protein [Acidiferrobacteraceae bacterium]